jgi:hypothetical protein
LLLAIIEMSGVDSLSYSQRRPNVVYRGRVEHGVVKLEGDTRLADGTMVNVEPLEPEPPTIAEDSIYRVYELAKPTGIPDLAANVDHYLYGHPKVDDAQP